MTRISFRESPFASSQPTNDVPWTQWEMRKPLVDLQEPAQADNRHIPYERERLEENTERPTAYSMPQMNRHQYLSVVNRMNNASSKAVSFAAWNPETT